MNEPDPMAVKLFSYLVFTKLEGAVTAGMMPGPARAAEAV